MATLRRMRIRGLGIRGKMVCTNREYRIDLIFGVVGWIACIAALGYTLPELLSHI